MRRSTLATVGLPLLSALLLAIFFVLTRQRLPELVAVHWGAGGVADGFVRSVTVVWLFPAMAVGVGLLVAAVAGLNEVPIVGARLLRGLPLGIVWFVGTLGVATTTIQWGAQDPPPLPGWAIPLALGLGVIGGVLAGLVHGPGGTVPETNAPAPLGAPRANIEGTTAVWRGRTPTSPMMAGLAAAVIALGVVLGTVITVGVGILVAMVVPVLVVSSAFSITIGPAGLNVAGRFVGFPRVSVPLAQIASVEAGEVEAWDFGGWGIRIGTNQETAVITRSGPALVVHRTDGATLRISLDQPEEAAAVVSSLLDRR